MSKRISPAQELTSRSESWISRPDRFSSKHVADDLEHYPRWQAQLHDLGECELKHGIRISAVNLYNDEIGNPAVPEKFKAASRGRVWTAHPKPVIRKWALIGAAILISHRHCNFSFWQRAKMTDICDALKIDRRCCRSTISVAIP